MKRRGKLGILIIATSFVMSACGSSIPEMTEEQSAQVAEYAAGLLLKYDVNYHSRLVEEPEGDEIEAEAEQEPAKVQEENPVNQEVEETPVVEVGEETGGTVYSSIEEFYGIDGVQIGYDGYEIKDMYPSAEEQTEDEDGNLFFAMTATTGCKLIVLHFDVANVSGQDLDLDMLSLGTKFKISINGEAPRYALTTMLMDDLSSYMGTIPSDSSEKLVLVGEIPEEKTGDVQSISLIMKNASDSATISLN